MVVRGAFAGPGHAFAHAHARRGAKWPAVKLPANGSLAVLYMVRKAIFPPKALFMVQVIRSVYGRHALRGEKVNCEPELRVTA